MVGFPLAEIVLLLDGLDGRNYDPSEQPRWMGTGFRLLGDVFTLAFMILRRYGA